MILLSRNGRVRADIFSRRRIDEARSSSSRQKTHCHADQLAERIVPLDGEPNVSPEELMGCSHAEYVEGATLAGIHPCRGRGACQRTGQSPARRVFGVENRAARSCRTSVTANIRRAGPEHRKGSEQNGTYLNPNSLMRDEKGQLVNLWGQAYTL